MTFIKSSKYKLLENKHNIHPSESEWNNCLERMSIIPPFYKWNMINYYLEYFNSDKYLKLILKDDNKFVGVFFIIIKNDNEIISAQNCILEPVYIDDFDSKKKEKINNDILDFIFYLKDEFKVQKLNFRVMQPGLFTSISDWHYKISQISTSNEDIFSLYINLKLSIQNIKTQIRKSYKSLINKGFKIWNINLFDSTNITEKIWNDFKKLHFESAGFKTRSDDTWNLQYKMILENEAFIIAANNDDHEFIGFALILTGKNISQYGVAAYNRNLFDLPIGHPIQMKVIEILKEKKHSLYYLGDISSNGDEKLNNIIKFKKGFANSVFLEKIYQFN